MAEKCLPLAEFTKFGEDPKVHHLQPNKINFLFEMKNKSLDGCANFYWFLRKNY